MLVFYSHLWDVVDTQPSGNPTSVVNIVLSFCLTYKYKTLAKKHKFHTGLLTIGRNWNANSSIKFTPKGDYPMCSK